MEKEKPILVLKSHVKKDLIMVLNQKWNIEGNKKNSVSSITITIHGKVNDCSLARR